jgi:hypothetical protein
MFGVGPFIEPRKAEPNRHKADRDQRQLLISRFEDAANRQSPGPAAQVMDHGDRQRAGRNAPPKQPGRQIGGKKTLRREVGLESADRRADKERHKGDAA